MLRLAFSFRRLTCPSNSPHLRSRHTLGMCFSSGSAAKEFKVVLDNGTLYVDQELAEALGWDPAKKESVPLTLNGWAPQYFAVARTGSDADALARRTAESGRNTNVQKVLEYLKDR
ncbi:hypothetical protein C8Q74DRAFT_1317747 [Fomes fomentarius]|nr:hypothetical protein C8Q74DRAFT_1317747 [Fomes fomentarius]